MPTVGPAQWLFPERKPAPPPTSGDWATEYLAARIFDRPVRSNLKDTPFYPYIKHQYNVYFGLNYQ